jgi:hypothetical protein
MGWFTEYPPGTPVRRIANVEEANRIRRILNDIKGVGCRIEKPENANGLGWRIIVDGTTDVDPIPDSGVGTDTGQVPYKPYDLEARARAAIPSGIIAMWSGLVSAIPSGWALCDGTSGTPDLRHKFIRGAGDTGYNAPGDTGGADSHGHSASGSVSKSDLAHTHQSWNPSDTGGDSESVPVDSGAGYAMPIGAVSYGADWQDSSSAPVSVSVASASSLPKYYALAFIMKT